MLSFLISQDIALLNFLRSFVDPFSEWQLKLIHIGSDIEVALVIFLLVGLWLYGVYKKNDRYKFDALMMLYSIGFAFLIYIILNLGLPFRPRPETVSIIRPFIDHLPDNSFPSGHGIFAGASTLAAFLYVQKKIAWTLLFMGLFMGLSRVLAGIHYPGDIVVGYFIGLMGTYVVYVLRDRKYMTQYLLVYPLKIAAFFRL